MLEASKKAWQQAHMQEKEGILVPFGEVDEAALLKARTLLAYLMDKNKLSYEVHNSGTDSMIVVRNSNFRLDISILNPELMDEMWAYLNYSPTIEAVVMYRPYEPIAKQPALAFLRSNTETTSLFNKVWLKSSLSWLKKNPQDRVDLDITYG